MTSSLRPILLAIAILVLPSTTTAQPPAGGQPAAQPSGLKARANAALARYSQANMACDEAGKRAAADELNALAAEAQRQLSAVRAMGAFSSMTLAEAQQQVSDVALAIAAAQALPRAPCPPGQTSQPATPQPGPGAAPQPTQPGRAPTDTGAGRDPEEEPEQLGVGSRVFGAIIAIENASEACDLDEMTRQVAILEALVVEARQKLQAARAAGQFSTINIPAAQRELASVESYRDIGRRIAIRQQERCRRRPGRVQPGPATPTIPGPQPATPGTGATPQPGPGATPGPRPPARQPTPLERRARNARDSVSAARLDCNMAVIRARLAELDAIHAEAEAAVRRIARLGEFAAEGPMREAIADAEAVERLRLEARLIAAECRQPGQAQPPPESPPVADVMDPGFRDPATDIARDLADDYEEARQACDDQAMRAARVRLERELELAQEVAAYGATVTGTDARTLRLKEIANKRVRDIQALIDGLGRGPAPACPPDTATPTSPMPTTPGGAPQPAPQPQPGTTPPAPQPEPPAVPRQRAIRGLFGALGVGMLVEEDTNIGFASLGGGYRFGDHFGIEGEAAIGLLDEENEAGGFSDSLGIDFDLAAYAVGYLPLSDRADLFARLGYGYTEFGFSLQGPGIDFEESNGADSFRYGLGVQVFVDDANGFRATWTRWDEFEDGGVDADVFVVSYVRRFGGAG